MPPSLQNDVSRCQPSASKQRKPAKPNFSRAGGVAFSDGLVCCAQMAIEFFRSLAKDAVGLEETPSNGNAAAWIGELRDMRCSDLVFPRFKRRPAVEEVAASFFAVLEVPRKGHFVFFPQVGDCLERCQFAASAVE